MAITYFIRKDVNEVGEEDARALHNLSFACFEIHLIVPGQEPVDRERYSAEAIHG
jgi:hypothetical protein